MMHNLSGSIKFVVGNGTWAIIVLILLLALVFKVLYIRHNIPYAEHFIFHVYGHTRLLLIAIAAILLNKMMESDIWSLIWMISGFVYLILGMRAYYKQGPGKTWMKLFITLGSYVVLLIVCSFLIFGVSFIVF